MPNYEAAARRAAQKHGIDPDIFVAQLKQESGLRMNVGSSAGAQDIAQFMPATARAYGVTLGDNRASDDLDGAARYMKDNLRKYGNYKRALSAYNSGRPDAYKDPSFAKGQTYNYVKNILAKAGTSGGSGATGGSSSPTAPKAPSEPATRTVTTPGVDNSGMRQQLKQQYLLNRDADPNALLSLASGLKQAQDTPSTTKTENVPVKSSDSVAPSGSTEGIVAKAISRAGAIDRKHMPYLWGGGHGGKVNAYKATPLDCSGAVSAVLGIDPRVSGQFTKWGKPGAGGKTNVYANGHHVLMEINGHFFGTSHSNPGGGAGWIKRSDISADYLKGFTARHI